MSQHRFEDLSASLHFVNNEDQVRDKEEPTYHPLFKLGVLVNVIASWKAAVHPCKHASINESMILFHGRVGFRQNIKLKHHCYGVKAFALCDASTSYCIKYDIYTGCYYDYDQNVGQGCSVVLKLASGMPAGTIFYTDSFYTSPTLKLMQLRMGIVGTALKNRRGMPDVLKAPPRPNAKFMFKDHILAVSFKDHYDVRMLSTVHGTGTYERRTRAAVNSAWDSVCSIQMIMKIFGETIGDCRKT